MAPRAHLTVPTASALQSSSRLPCDHPSVLRILSRLSRPSLVFLAHEWLKPRNRTQCTPYLAGHGLENESMYEAAHTIDEIVEVFTELGKQKGGKRDVLDRMLEGDWRHGISLRQLAMADVQYLLDHPNSLRWTALKLAPLHLSSDGEDHDHDRALSDAGCLPRFHAPSFLNNLQKEVGPLVKAHYNLARVADLPVTLLRVYALDSPYNTHSQFSKAASDANASKTIYIAFPDNSSSIYVSFAAIPGQQSAKEGKDIRQIIVDALPKALSQPQNRFALKPTSLSARSLSALVAVRGPGNTNAAAGGWSVFAEGTVEESPLRSSGFGVRGIDDEKENNPLPKHISAKRKIHTTSVETHSETNTHEEALQKRRCLVAKARFGYEASDGDGKGIERLEVRVEDPFALESVENEVSDEADLTLVPPQMPVSRKGRRSTLSMMEDDNDQLDERDERITAAQWEPKVQFIFHGTHVFAGIRKLVEVGAIDGEKMPGWMTGENGVSIGVVRNGRIRGNKGSGL